MTTLQTPVCVVCHQPIEFDDLKSVDEKGKPVHELCYVGRAVKKRVCECLFGDSI